MENINKIAGPFVEAWAIQVFHNVLEDKNNKYHLINVETVERLHIADVILQFQKQRKVESGITAEVDVKENFFIIPLLLCNKLSINLNCLT